MQLPYRVTRHNRPERGETLIGSEEQARGILAGLERRISDRKGPKWDRAEAMNARAVLYAALGDRKMLWAAEEAHRFSETAQTCALLATALHHFGRLREALLFYERAYRLPHEPGTEIDIGYVNKLIFEDRWAEAHKVALRLKKRMVYAAHLPEWTEKQTDRVSVISEGGFGDIIYYSRWLPFFRERGVSTTAYLPNMFYEGKFIDLLRRQRWFPEVKPLLETPQHVPAVGFLDMPSVFGATQETIPFYPEPWTADPEKTKEYAYLRDDRKPVVGFCWSARAMETPLCPDGVYRALTDEQAKTILRETDGRVRWVSLQYANDRLFGVNLERPRLRDWEDTAGIIANLDFVVTVDTGVMHLAGAMGKPLWILLSGAVDSKWGFEGDGCAAKMYLGSRTFRNKDFGFDNTVQKAIEAIKGEAG